MILWLGLMIAIVLFLKSVSVYFWNLLNLDIFSNIVHTTEFLI